MDSPNAAPELNGNFSVLSIIDFCIVPHCTNFTFKKAAEKIAKEFSDTLDLRLISNNQVIVVDGEKAETLTTESKRKQLSFCPKCKRKRLINAKRSCQRIFDTAITGAYFR
jgi:peptidase E